MKPDQTQFVFTGTVGDRKGRLTGTFTPDEESDMSTPKPDPNGHTAHAGNHEGGGHQPPPGGNGGHADNNHGEGGNKPPQQKLAPPPRPPAPPKKEGGDDGYPWWLWALLILALLIGAGWLFREGCDGCNTPTPPRPPVVIDDGSGSTSTGGFDCPQDIPADLRSVWRAHCAIVDMDPADATDHCLEQGRGNRADGRRCAQLQRFVFAYGRGDTTAAQTIAAGARHTELGQ